MAETLFSLNLWNESLCNLWNSPQANACIEEILPFVDIFFCSERARKISEPVFLSKYPIREALVT
jgi:hypothetical protein